MARITRQIGMVDPNDPKTDESRPASPELLPDSDPREENPELEEAEVIEEGAPDLQP